MSTSCCAHGCTERTKKGGHSFHSFPIDPELSKSWVIAMGRDEFTPTKHSRLCGKHFVESDFIINFGQRLLKKGAVPSKFDFPKSEPKPLKNMYGTKSLKDSSLPPTSIAETESEAGPTSSSVRNGKGKRKFREPKPKKLKIQEEKNVLQIAVKQNATIKALRTKHCNSLEKIKSTQNLVEHIKIKNQATPECFSLLQGKQTSIKYTMENSNSGTIQYVKSNCWNPFIKYHCRHCDFTTDLWITSKDHVWRYHTSFHNYSKTDPSMIKVYTCNICNFTSYSTLMYRLHESKCTNALNYPTKENKCSESPVRSTQSDTNLYECEHCDYSVKSEKFLNAHFKRKHKIDRVKYECSQCFYKSVFKSSLKRHFVTHLEHPPEICWFECDQCEFKAETNYRLKVHVEDEHKSGKYECCQCSYRTLYKRDLNAHMTSHYVGPKEFKLLQCGFCDYKAGIKNLTKHTRLKHSEVQCRSISWFECGQCEFKSEAKYRLKVHVENEHNPGNYECCRCSYKTISKKDLKTHMTLHYVGSKAQYKCTQCAFKTAKDAILKRHYVRNHTHWSKCHKCQYRSKQRCGLIAHVNSKRVCDYVDPKKMKLLQCCLCDYRAEINNLTRHIRLEHSAVQYKCTKCSFKTVIKPNLRSHYVRNHTDLKNFYWFKCDQCEYKTKRKSCLDSHINRKHDYESQMFYDSTKFSYKNISKDDLRKLMNAQHTESEDNKFEDKQGHSKSARQ